ncbi:MAG: SDR family oxidoreductase [Anaerolineae bacterium]|nr:SDR family oxidoreductase [Anaerolineae bacterium]
MHIDMRGRVAAVTGAAHRVGRVIALELARSGVSILVHHFHSPDDVVRETLHAVKSFGVDAFPVRADLSMPDGVDAVFDAVRAQFGRLDILVNSASNFQRRRLLDVTLDEWDETLRINLTAPFLCTQRAIRLMRDNQPSGGVIVNICDRGALEPWVDYAHHGISKAGLLALTKVTAAGYAPDIRANAVIPGLVLKPDGMDESRWQQYARETPLERPGSAEDVGRAVVYLASEDFVTGAVLHVDGGSLL